jgi:tetratricopeptide (TPR) repeat protein
MQSVKILLVITAIWVQTPFAAHAANEAMASNSPAVTDNKLDSKQVDLLKLERDVFLSPSADLDKIEYQTAKLLQVNSSSHWANYLMSSVLLRLYLREPSEVSLLRQSTSLAAQTYELDPTSELGYVALANILEVNGESDKGLLLLAEAKNKGLKFSWRFDFVKARLLAGDETQSKILDLYRSALEDPSAIRSLIAPYVLATFGTNTQSIPSSSAVKEWSTEFPCYEFSMAYANSLLNEGKIDQALAALEAADRIDPSRGEGLYFRALVSYVNLKDSKQAAALLSQIKSKKLPESILGDYTMLKAKTSLMLDPKTLPSALLAEAVRKANDRDVGVQEISNVLVDQKRFADLASFLETIHTEVPGIAKSYGISGDLLLSIQNKPDIAIRQYTNAILLDQGNPMYFNGRGQALYKLSKFDLARADFEMSMQLDPTDSSARYNLACMLALTSREKEALEILASAIEIDRKLIDKARQDDDFRFIKNGSGFKKILNTKTEEIVAH